MSLHRLTHIEIGVPNVAQTADYYQEFGLSRGADGAFSTTDGGEQLRVSHAAARRLVELGVGVDDEDDIARIAAALARAGFAADRPDPRTLKATDPVTRIRATFTVQDDLTL